MDHELVDGRDSYPEEKNRDAEPYEDGRDGVEQLT